MGSHKSADKSHRQGLRRRDVNRSNKSRLRTTLKTLRETVKSGDAAAAQKMLPATLSLIDKAIQKRVLHGNAAARHKSRLTRLVAGAARAAESKA